MTKYSFRNENDIIYTIRRMRRDDRRKFGPVVLQPLPVRLIQIFQTIN